MLSRYQILQNVVCVDGVAPLSNADKMKMEIGKTDTIKLIPARVVKMVAVLMITT